MLVEWVLLKRKTEKNVMNIDMNMKSKTIIKKILTIQKERNNNINENKINNFFFQRTNGI